MRICLFGGPGCGKSTLASKIFAELKIKGISIELISEYIKTYAYSGIKPISFDQCYVFSKQLHAEDLVLRNGVKHLVTDSPILMQVSYAKRNEFLCWNQLLEISKHFESVYPSLNIFLKRNDLEYQTSGRYENHDQARQMDEKIIDMLDSVADYAVFDSKDHAGCLQYVLESL